MAKIGGRRVTPYARLGFYLVAMVLLAALPRPAAAAAPAASPLLRPQRIVVNVDASVTDRHFLPELAGRLERYLAPDVALRPSTLDLGPLRANGSPLEGQAVTNAFIRTINWDWEAETIQVLLLGDDIRVRPARFNFAVSHGDATTRWHVIIVSLARLQQRGFLSTSDRAPSRTAERVFKLVTKNVAKASGYGSSTLCVFGFPRSVGELDAMPEGYCEPDRSILIDAGIARP